MFRVRYLLGIRNSLEDNVRITIGSKLPAAASPNIRDSDYKDIDDGDMSRLKDMGSNVDPNWDYTDIRTKSTREVEFPDRPLPTRERDHSSWMNRYEQERETRPPDEYPFQDFNYGP